jgi:hypothetical protein
MKILKKNKKNIFLVIIGIKFLVMMPNVQEDVTRLNVWEFSF